MSGFEGEGMEGLVERWREVDGLFRLCIGNWMRWKMLWFIGYEQIQL